MRTHIWEYLYVFTYVLSSSPIYAYVKLIRQSYDPIICACTYSHTDHVYSRKGPSISPFLFAYFFHVASNKSAKCILRRARYIWYSVPSDISCRFAFNLQRAGENALRLTFTEELRFIGAGVMSCVICTYITLVINEVA